MFGNGRLAFVTITASVAGLALLAASGPASASTPPEARTPAASTVSARAVPVGTVAASARPDGSYRTWRSAQRAAGFKLKRPSRTFGLTRKYPILVSKCDAAGQRRKHDVYAQWSGSLRRYLSIDQNNSGEPCSNFGAARYLASYRVKGHRARLYGFCGGRGQPGCRSINAVLVLAWRAGSRYYVTYSHHEWRRTLVSFARSLHFL